MSAPVGPPTWMRLLQGPAGNGPVGFDLAMLVLRVGFGVLMALHGWQKVQNYEMVVSQFKDPLDIGLSNSLALNLAIGAELACSALVVLGVFTRVAALPVLFTMGVAAFVVHQNDPVMMTGKGGAKEPALMYFIAFLAIFLAGPGRFSVDGALQPRQPERAP
ncbi:MAG: DoxX family protein [Gemmataceae bacterium]|nr:DoxX family protein [Gemmataceae bacterium]